MKELVEKIAKVQSNLKAPKNQRNSFGGYNYRSCEDILESVKPLLAEQSLILTINDEIIQVGDRFYVKATATITDGTNSVSNSAYAREAESKKGMDESQITGATSSYARKYALNGLLCIDDTKDADATNTHGKEDQVSPAKKALATKSVNKEIKKTDIDERYGNWMTYWNNHEWTQQANASFRQFLDDAKDYDSEKLKVLVEVFKKKAPEPMNDQLPDWA